MSVLEDNTPLVGLDTEVDCVVTGFAPHSGHSGVCRWKTFLLPFAHPARGGVIVHHPEPDFLRFDVRPIRNVWQIVYPILYELGVKECSSIQHGTRVHRGHIRLWGW